MVGIRLWEGNRTERTWPFNKKVLSALAIQEFSKCSKMVATWCTLTQRNSCICGSIGKKVGFCFFKSCGCTLSHLHTQCDLILKLNERSANISISCHPWKKRTAPLHLFFHFVINRKAIKQPARCFEMHTPNAHNSRNIPNNFPFQLHGNIFTYQVKVNSELLFMSHQVPCECCIFDGKIYLLE